MTSAKRNSTSSRHSIVVLSYFWTDGEEEEKAEVEEKEKAKDKKGKKKKGSLIIETDIQKQYFIS